MPTTYKDFLNSGYSPEALATLKNKYPDPTDEDSTTLLTGGGTDLAGYYEGQRNRIPRGNELEGMSSDTIADLLNPPDFFPEVDRRSAELASGRGIAGSPAGFGVGLRMTDDEKLKRIALGQGFLTAASGRNPAIDPQFLFQTPQQKAQLELDKQRLDLQKKAQELENELKRLQIRNLSTVSVGFASGGSNVQRTGGSLPTYGPGGASPLGNQDFSGTAPIGGGFQNTVNDLPENWDPNYDFTG